MDTQTVQAITEVIKNATEGNQKTFWDYMATLGIPGALLLFNYLDRKLYQNHLDRLVNQFIELSTNFVKGQEAQERVIDKMMDILRALKKP